MCVRPPPRGAFCTVSFGLGATGSLLTPSLLPAVLFTEKGALTSPSTTVGPLLLPAAPLGFLSCVQRRCHYVDQYLGRSCSWCVGSVSTVCDDVLYPLRRSLLPNLLWYQHGHPGRLRSVGTWNVFCFYPSCVLILDVHVSQAAHGLFLLFRPV